MTPIEIVALVQAVIQGGVTLVDYLRNLKTTLQQKGELTEAQEKEFDDLIERITSQPHWKPEGQ